MRKDLKEKLLKSNYRLYEKEWVEKAATDGFNRAMEGVREKEPAFARFSLAHYQTRPLQAVIA